MTAPLTIVGRAALSASRRARVLAKVKAAFPTVSAIDARWAHVIATARPLTAPDVSQLEAMLAYGPSDQASTVSRAVLMVWASCCSTTACTRASIEVTRVSPGWAETSSSSPITRPIESTATSL